MRPAPALLAFATTVLLWLGSPLAHAGDECTYKVKSGDTLDRIALRQGVSVQQLIAGDARLRKNPDLIRIGQEINICAAKSKAASGKHPREGLGCGGGRKIAIHTVKSGDTLSKIASRYNVPEEGVLRRNKKLGGNPDMLRVGQDLEICAGSARAKASKMCGYRTPLHDHLVTPGEHLGNIAGRYGVRRRDLIKWNPKLASNPNLVKVGSSLRVCPEIAPRERTQITHTVQSGQTFGGIAKKYDVTRRELLRYQRGKLKDANKLREGQRLVVWVDGGIVEGFTDISDDNGVLKAGVQLPPGSHYQIKWTTGSYGTVHAIRSIQQAVASYKRKLPGGPKVNIGDISKQGGGRFPPHVSHQHGRDVDVGYVLKGESGKGSRFRNANRSNLDAARTWALLKAFVDTGNVKHIFMDIKVQEVVYEYARKRGVSEDLLDEIFQYPRKRRHGIIQHWKGHTNHFHVRFRR